MFIKVTKVDEITNACIR